MAAYQQFGADLRNLTAIMHDEKRKAWRAKASVNWQQVEMSWDEYLRGRGADEWRQTFLPAIRGVVAEQGSEWAVTLGAEFDVRNLEAEAWFQDYMLQFAQPINQTTSEGLHVMVEQAMAEGWSVPMMQRHMGTLFEQWMSGGKTAEDFEWYQARMPGYRREAIARTETMHASNAGCHNLYDQWGVGAKEWLSTNDARTRDSHREAGTRFREGGEAGPIPMNRAFVVGGYPMMYPGDSSTAPPSEYINCRCTLLPYLEEATQPSRPLMPARMPPRTFSELYEAAEYEDEYAEWANGLSQEERVAIEEYAYLGYRSINARLRAGIALSRERAEMVAALDSALGKSPGPRTDVMVYRGVEPVALGIHGDATAGDVLKQSERLVGKAFLDPGYMSASLLRDRAARFTDEGVVYSVRVPAGARAAQVSAISEAGEEMEFLIARGSRLRITGVRSEHWQYVVAEEVVERDIVVIEAELEQ